MSDVRSVDFYCPHCRAPNHAELHTLVDAQAEPGIAAQLLAGTLSEVVCEGCRQSAHFDHSLVYLDRSGSRAVWLAPPDDPLAITGEPDVTPRERMRRVEDSNSLRELAAIWNDGLDDAAMLLLKHMLAARMLDQTGNAPVLCAYEDRFNQDGEEWLEYVVFTSEEGDPESLRTPFSTYQSVAGAAAEHATEVFPPGRWVQWDDVNAQALWEAMQSR